MIGSTLYFISFSFQATFNTICRNFRKNPKRYCVVFFKKQVFIWEQIQDIFFNACHYSTLSSLLISN